MAEEEQDDIDPSAGSTSGSADAPPMGEADDSADEEEKKRFNPQLVVYPLMMIVATAMAAGIPLLLYSEKSPENEEMWGQVCQRGKVLGSKMRYLAARRRRVA